jgi:hypothetical protein
MFSDIMCHVSFFSSIYLNHLDALGRCRQVATYKLASSNQAVPSMDSAVASGSEYVNVPEKRVKEAHSFPAS